MVILFYVCAKGVNIDSEGRKKNARYEVKKKKKQLGR